MNQSHEHKPSAGENATVESLSSTKTTSLDESTNECFPKLIILKRQAGEISTNSTELLIISQESSPQIPSGLVTIEQEITEPGGDQNKKLKRIPSWDGFTCEICIEQNSTIRKFQNENLCSHPFCVDCISKYIEAKILDNTAKISCPGLNCQHDLDPVSNMSLISKPLFTKWCDLLCESFVLTLNKSYCPNSKCMEMVLNECEGSVKKTFCPNCKILFCFDCKTKWHAGFKCEESEAMTRDENVILLGKLIETHKWQRCPDCGHCVQRTTDAGQSFATPVERKCQCIDISVDGNCNIGELVRLAGGKLSVLCLLLGLFLVVS
ncbi:hypothetical protein ACFE04_006244 [Oxalis oulophora]